MDVMIAVVSIVGCVSIALYATWLFAHRLKAGESPRKSFWQWLKHLGEAVWGSDRAPHTRGADQRGNRGAAMKSLVVGISLLVAGAACAEAPSPDFSFRELDTCSEKRNPYLSPPSVQAKRRSGRVVVTVHVSTGCSESVSPSVAFRGSAVTIAIATLPTKGPIAACLCSRHFEFTLLKPVRKGSVLYLVQNGDARAHAIAP